MSEHTKKLRSASWFSKNDLPGFVHRSTLSTTGFRRSDFGGRPVIGILNSWSDINPCNLNIRYLANEARKGIIEAGGMPFELPVMSLSENIIKPTSFLYRNLLAIEAEENIRAYPLDGVLLIGGCDKTIPGLLMGAVSAGVPTLVLGNGPSAPRETAAGPQGTGTTVWRFVDRLRAGEVDKADFDQFEEDMVGVPGHCNEMGTASTVASICEALGIAMSGSALVPAGDGKRAQLARSAGRRITEIAAQGGPTPRDVLTAEAFDNAITLLCAVGGSTNVILHLLALAGRAGVPLALARFDEIARNTPLIGNVQPSGAFLTARLNAAGGIPAVLAELGNLINRDVTTVDERPLAELLETQTVRDREVVKPVAAPLRSDPSLVVLRGTLAPNGAVIKASAADGKLFQHRGPARVFESVQELADQIDDPALEITPETVLVLRGVGPVGAMMPEWGMLPIPRYLMERGVTDMVRISDARMSGTAYGTAILHVAPEAAVGGPLALVETGDIIELDVRNRRLDLLVDQAELERRKGASQPVCNRYSRGWRKMFVEHVGQADTGCDLDFLIGSDDETLPEGLFEGWVGGW